MQNTRSLIASVLLCLCAILARMKQSGFTLVELLITITIIGILAGLVLTSIRLGRLKAHDNSIRNDVGQLRWIAEQMADTKGASYLNWRSTATPVLRDSIKILLDDIEKSYGTLDAADNYPTSYPASYQTVIRESQTKEYCVSAPLRSEPGKYYCIDATAVFRVVSQPCPDIQTATPPLRCPPS